MHKRDSWAAVNSEKHEGKRPRTWANDSNDISNDISLSDGNEINNNTKQLIKKFFL
jgi:hypothetical protein